MSLPVIFAIDDEPAVLGALARDLRSEYGSQFRIVRSSSGESALEALRELRVREEPVALVIVDQRMPGMSGSQLLSHTRELYPQSKRVLLTAYADSSVAIQAINEIKLDHYLLKPWDPPEERLFPVLNELLDDWQATAGPQPEGVRLIGYRWSPESHTLKDFLARNLVPYRWLDLEEHEEARGLLELEGESAQLPLVLLPDGGRLQQPTPADIATRIGLRSHAMEPLYDLVILGAGPAGLAAAVSSASEGMRTLLIEREAPGGQAGTSSRIENYFGFHAGISGSELARRGKTQAERFGVEILTPVEAAGITAQGRYQTVMLADGSEVRCHALLISTGLSYTRFEVPGADRLMGAGVYYGAANTEALQVQGVDVCVVGGGNSAGQGALHLARYAQRVIMLIRGASPAAGMSRYLYDQLLATPNIEIRSLSRVVMIQGNDHVESVEVEQIRTGARETLTCGAVFVFIGAVPRTEFLGNAVKRDQRGFVFSGADVLISGRKPEGWSLTRPPYWLETSASGVFVAGDVRHRSIRRVASAVGEGAMAVQFVHQHIAGL